MNRLLLAGCAWRSCSESEPGTDENTARTEALHNNEGRITFIGGTGFGANAFKVYRIVYDPSEDGYNN